MSAGRAASIDATRVCHFRVVAMFASHSHSCTFAMSVWWSGALVAAVALNGVHSFSVQ